ncbi:Protein kinase domain family protein [Leishmania donovani]|uniref:Protein kinase domain family protein n=1 Tax=Leishmania donovani TaxID=5661 RepID=A0A504Y356_LEIDO|nr:Protein kinase domain family protein [Leishmania donovani]
MLDRDGPLTPCSQSTEHALRWRLFRSTDDKSEPLSCTAGTAPGKRASARRGSRAAPTTNRSGKRGSVGLLLPAVHNDKDVAVVAVKGCGNDDGGKPEENTPFLKSATTPAVALAFPIASLCGNRGGGLTAAVTDELPPLCSPSWMPLHKTRINADPQRSPPPAPANHIRSPVGSASSQSLAISPLSTKPVDIPSPERKPNSGVVTGVSISDGGAVWDRRAHSITVERREEAGYGAMVAKGGKASSSLSKATAGRVGSQEDDIGSRRTRRKMQSGKKSTQRSLKAAKNTAVPSSASSGAQWCGGPGPAAQPIRTKVSREGDVNVKVIFAARSRHCFRRYVKEVMTRFGFRKATDFDMYCIDQYGDRVDIDTEEDFEQLLDAFTEAMGMVGKDSLVGSPDTHASPPPPSLEPLHHLYGANQSTGSCGMPAAGDGSSMSRHARERAMSFSASQNHTSSFYAAKSFSLSPRLDATIASSISAGSLVEDDGKSSGSVLRLYVRYSNAYYTEHRREFEQQMNHSLLYPQAMLSNGGSGAVGSPLARNLLAFTTCSVGSGGGDGGAISSHDELNAVHGKSSDWAAASADSMSMQFNETLNSNLAKTLRLDEAEPLDWRRMSVLGKGSFGTVYEGITQDGKMLAVKVQELSLDDGEDAEAVKAVKAEINLMRSLKHKNIVTYYGCQTRVLPTGNQQMEVFLELCHGGSLASLRRKFVKAKESFSISLVRSYTRQVLEGLAYLHAQNVVHRDIKSDNVLISAMGEAKLADFGCSKRLGPATLQGMPGTLPPGAAPAAAAPSPQEAAVARAAMHQTVVGSPFFMAPEALREDGSYTGAADIWSVGCLVLELLGREPWDITGKNIFQIMFRISKEKGMPTGVPKKCPAILLDFFERCFQRDTKRRATAVELLEHEWLTCPDKALEEVPPSPLSQKESPAE